ncbi:MAG TPA: energy transducer TonB [Sphingobacteriaceae bacterium]|nr:energy transducer TonB [Sphingobacteriaceae bacterium]
MAKLDIYKSGWIDVVFAGRNKDYGAYQLRKDNSKTTSKAMLIGGGLFILLLSANMIYKYVSGNLPSLLDRFKQHEITLAAPPPIENKPPPPPPPPPPAPKVPEIRFPPPVVVPADEVKDQDPPTISDLKIADAGQKTIEGDPNADVKIEVAEAPKVAKVVEERQVVQMETVQILPLFPGGPAAWAKFVGDNYNYPALARENNMSGKVIVSFVVEKDGTLTGFKVVRDFGFGSGEEAIRMLKSSPPWSPGIQNGLKVPVAYTQPIVLTLGN